jgi:aldose 1-epimerase
MADAPFSFVPHGATIQTFKIKGINIVQGFDTQDQYIEYNKPFFGETVGRVANRLKGAQLDSVDGKTWPLPANDRTNSLHGGFKGWGKQIWSGPKPVGTRDVPGVQGLEGGESVEFTLTSKDGDEGYPGTVEARIVYTTGIQRGAEDGKDVTVLGIDYEAKLVDGAEETAINLTNHSYFNLAGCPDATTFEGTTITLATNNHLPVDELAIPKSGPTPFPDLDTSKPFTMTSKGPDVDHCFTLTDSPGSVPIDTRHQPLARNLIAHHPGTGIHLEVLSTEPSFQFYTGHGTNVPAVGNIPARGPRSAFCCEPGRWVNAANVPEWKSMSLLKKGETYGARIVYRGWAD